MTNSLFTPKLMISSLAIALLYLVMTTFLMNSHLSVSTIFGDFPLSYKIALSIGLIKGIWTIMTHQALIILMLISLLTGFNISLLVQRFTKLVASNNKLHFVIGGSSLLGIVGSGCAACGLPLVALFGITGSLLNLPLHGQEFSYLAVVLLTVSFIILLRSTKKAESCLINTRYNVSH